MEDILFGIAANLITPYLIVPLIIWGLGALWWFKKKYSLKIKVPSQKLEGRFDIRSIFFFSFARSYLFKTEKGNDTEMYFKYYGIRRSSKYFFYWTGDRGNGFCIIQSTQKNNNKYEGKNLFFEKLDTGVTKITDQEFFLSDITTK